MTASIILTPYASEHGPDSLDGWAAYLNARGDVPDETIIEAVASAGDGLLTVAVIYRTNPPRCSIVGNDHV